MEMPGAPKRTLVTNTHARANWPLGREAPHPFKRSGRQTHLKDLVLSDTSASPNIGRRGVHVTLGLCMWRGRVGQAQKQGSDPVLGIKTVLTLGDVYRLQKQAPSKQSCFFWGRNGHGFSATGVLGRMCLRVCRDLHLSVCVMHREAEGGGGGQSPPPNTELRQPPQKDFTSKTSLCSRGAGEGDRLG